MILLLRSYPVIKDTTQNKIFSDFGKILERNKEHALGYSFQP